MEITKDSIRKYYKKKHLPPDIAGGTIGGIGIVCSIFLAFSKDEVHLIHNLFTISIVGALICWLSVWLVTLVSDLFIWIIHMSFVRELIKAVKDLLAVFEKSLKGFLWLFLILFIILAIINFLFTTNVGGWILGMLFLLIVFSLL
jgi:hypothetical protein